MKPYNKRYKNLIVFLILGITNLLWILAKIVTGEKFFADEIPTYMSQFFAINGTMLMSFNFILALRMKFIERLFGGLDKMYKFHDSIGRYGFVLLWLHPVFLLLNNFIGFESVLRYFLPGRFEAINYGIASLYLLTLLIFLTIVVKLKYEIWKQIHKLMLFTLILGGLHINLARSDTTTFLPLKLWLLAFVVIGVLSWLYIELIYSRWGKHIHVYKVKDVKTTGDITELTFDPVKNPIEFSGGQYAFISFEHNDEISREHHPYSFSSGPNDELRISSKALGNYSEKLSDMDKGDLVKMIGPYGFFTYDSHKHKKNQLWIAGGIGVTPFLSMLSEMVDKNADNHIDFIYSVKNREEAIYNDEIKEKISKLKNARFFEHYSDETGFLNALVIEKMLKESILDHRVLICGPRVMMLSLQDHFVKLGMKKDEIVFEDFSFK